jgi:hypothetical protein
LHFSPPIASYDLSKVSGNSSKAQTLGAIPDDEQPVPNANNWKRTGAGELPEADEPEAKGAKCSIDLRNQKFRRRPAVEFTSTKFPPRACKESA